MATICIYSSIPVISIFQFSEFLSFNIQFLEGRLGEYYYNNQRIPHQIKFLVLYCIVLYCIVLYCI